MVYRYLGQMSPELKTRRQQRLQNLYRALTNWDSDVWGIGAGTPVGLTGAGMLLGAIGRAIEGDMGGVLAYAAGLYGTAIFGPRILEKIDNYMSSQSPKPSLEVVG